MSTTLWKELVRPTGITLEKADEVIQSIIKDSNINASDLFSFSTKSALSISIHYLTLCASLLPFMNQLNDQQLVMITELCLRGLECKQGLKLTRVVLERLEKVQGSHVVLIPLVAKEEAIVGIQTLLLKSKTPFPSRLFTLLGPVLRSFNLDELKRVLDGVDKLLLRQPEVVIEILFGLVQELDPTLVQELPLLELMVNPLYSSNEKIRKDTISLTTLLLKIGNEKSCKSWIGKVTAKSLNPDTKIAVYGLLGSTPWGVDALMTLAAKENLESGLILSYNQLAKMVCSVGEQRQKVWKMLCDGINGKQKAAILAVQEIDLHLLNDNELALLKKVVTSLVGTKDLIKNIGTRDGLGVDELMIVAKVAIFLGIEIDLDVFMADRFVHKASQIGQSAVKDILLQTVTNELEKLWFASTLNWFAVNGHAIVSLALFKSLHVICTNDSRIFKKISDILLQGTQAVLKEEVVVQNLWGDIPARSSKQKTSRLVDALLRLVPHSTSIVDENTLKQVLMDWFVVCAHPTMALVQGDDLWIRLVYKAGLQPEILDEYNHYVDSWLKLENNGVQGGLQGPFKGASLKALRLAFEIAPILVLDKALPFITEVLTNEKLAHVTSDDMSIWSTPEGVVCFDPLLKQESKKGLTKDQKWELEMRKELEKKGAVKRTKQEMELIEKQLKKESDIRAFVSELKEGVDVGLDIIGEFFSIIAGHMECKSVFSGYVPAVVDLLLYNVIRRECVIVVSGRDVDPCGAISNGRSIRLFHHLAQIYLQDSVLDPILVSNAILVSFGVDETHLTERFQKPLNVLLKAIVEQLHDDEELMVLEPVAFTQLFPLLKHVVMKEGPLLLAKEKQYTEMVMCTADILLAHAALEEALYLPRGEMVDCLLKLINDYPRLRTTGRDGLMAMGVALSHFDIDADKKQEEIVTVVTERLLQGMLSSEAAVRFSSVSTLVHLPLIDSLQTKYYTILWLARFDNDENTRSEAQELWSELYDDAILDIDLVPMLVDYAIHRNGPTRESTGKAVCCVLEKYRNKLDFVLETLYEFYREYVKDPVPELDEYGMVKPESLNRPDPFEQRSGVAVSLRSCVPVIKEKKHVMSVFRFLITENPLGDRNDIVRHEMLQAGLELLEQQAKPYIKELLDLFDRTLSSLRENDDYVRQALVVLMGTLARYLEPTDKRIVETVVKLIDTLKTPSEDVQIVISDCLPALIKINKDHVGVRIKELLDLLFTSESRAHRRGAAYGLAGIVKGTGVSALKDHLIMAHLKEAVEDKRNIQKREGALFAFETLSYMLGRMFEPYVIQILPLLLVCYGDNNKNIRDATEVTCRVIMSKLSAHCVKLLLPSLLNGLEDRSFKTKIGAIEIMASMSALAPKQLGQSLPTIVPKICETLGDSHKKVQEAAKEALEHFGKVIKNPEIQGLVPVLIAALVNPNQKTLPALAELLDTTFVHYIDAPSLALLVPIIHRGLKERSAETKKKAAQIMGNMASLTEPSDLAPYLETLVPPLKEVLIDPVPEARATAAKAFGSMIAKLGEEKFSGLVDELLETLSGDAGGVDRSGAAQGLAEVLSGIGLTRLEELLPLIINQANSVKAYAREGFTMLLVYLPHTFGEKFTPYISRIVPTMLEGLADEIETVRETALHLGQVIVRNYYKSAVTLVLPELEKGLFNENWRIRQNSVQLIGDLIFKIAGISQQQSVDENEDGEGFGAEHHRIALKSALGNRYETVLASLYIVRSDTSGLVRNTSIGVWKAIVANTPKTLKQILPVLMNILLASLASNSYEKRSVAARTLGDLVRRLGENILDSIIPILQDGLESDDNDTREGVCIGLCEVMSSGGKLIESDFLYRCTPLIRKALVDESSDVRTSAAQAFDILHQLIGSKAIDEIIPELLASLKVQTNDFALEGLKEIMAVRSNAVFPVLIPTLLSKPITSSNAQALSSLISVAGSALTKRLDTIIPALMDELDHESEASEDILSALESIMTSVEGDGLYKVTTILKDILDEGNVTQKVTACKCLALFFSGSDDEVDDYMQDFITVMIGYLAESDAILVQESWNALDTIVKRIRKDDMHHYVNSIRNGIRFSEQNLALGEEVPGFNLSKGISPLITILLQGLMTGEVDTREISAYTLGDVINRTSDSALKPFVTQVTGPLIRVIGDRFPASVKTAILSTLGLLLTKVPTMLKPFLPQLQRTFVKSLSEAGSTTEMRNKTAQCLSLLIPLQARLDPLVTELVQGIKQSDSEIKKTMWEAMFGLLKGVGRNSGKTLSDSSHSNIQSLLLETILTSTEYEVSQRVGAAKCFGIYCESLSVERAQLLVEELCADVESKEWIQAQGILLCIENIVRYAFEIINESLKDRMVAITTQSLQSSKSSVLEAAIQVSLELISRQLHTSLLIETLVNVCQPTTESTDARREAIICIKNIAKNTHQKIVPILMLGVRDRTIPVKLAAERALVYILQIRNGTETLDKCLKKLEGPQVRSIGDYAKRVLTKIGEKDSDVEDNE